MGGICGSDDFVGDGALGLVVINRIECVEDIILAGEGYVQKQKNASRRLLFYLNGGSCGMTRLCLALRAVANATLSHFVRLEPAAGSHPSRFCTGYKNKKTPLGAYCFI